MNEHLVLICNVTNLIFEDVDTVIDYYNLDDISPYTIYDLYDAEYALNELDMYGTGRDFHLEYRG